jgi:hypothetical protein
MEAAGVCRRVQGTTVGDTACDWMGITEEVGGELVGTEEQAERINPMQARREIRCGLINVLWTMD